jgi:CheY-like chemotaxis protein
MTPGEREPITLRVPRRRRIFQDLMRHRVRHILLVSSLYDSFILTEDGQLNEALMRQFVDLNLNQNPDVIRVSSGAEAVALAREEGRFDMIITSIQVGDMNAVDLARAVKEAGLGIPVVLLAYNNRELSHFLNRHGRDDLDRVFLWQGDVRILVAMVKDQEDRRNVKRDTGRLGVPALLVVEDNIRFYSSFLPVIYSELMDHSQQLLSEGLNLSQKILRMRARPKLLLCETFEEAWGYFEKYEENILGVLSDFEFSRNGKLDRRAGFELVSRIHKVRSDIPTVMQSSIPGNEAIASALNAAFLLKGSPLLLHNLRDLLVNRFGFGDFVFCMPDGSAIDRAGDLKSLVDKLKTVPLESVAFHGERNHFSMWLKARTEYSLAEVLRPRKVSEFGSLEELRRNLVDALSAYRLARDRSVTADFDRSSYEQSISMARIGSGSLGGKARGLAFVNRLLLEAHLAAQFPELRIGVPSSVVLGTDIFGQFLEKNQLDDFALSTTSDDEIRERFATAHFPRTALRDLRAFLQKVEYPLAVRSSGLLEDSPSQPLAGVYRTVMVPNIGSIRDRLADLVAAIKSVYASTFSQQAKAFLKMTPFRLEEEKMAVIIQQIVGRRHGDRFYPDFSGVARSHNVYPSPPMKVEDGIAAVALGLGWAVVEGCNCVRFSPRYPRNVLAFSSVDNSLKDSQREFFALDLSRKAVRKGASSSPSICRARRCAKVRKGPS